MAASMIRRVMQSLPIFRSKVPVFTTNRQILQSLKPQTAICRTITQQQMEKNKKQFQKRMFQYLMVIVIVAVISPYVRDLRFASFEPRRDKKRRKLQALKEAEEREKLGDNFQQTESDHNISSSDDSFRPITQEEQSSVFPVVKAAKVFDEGDGYVPPRSNRFNFIADAVDIAAPSVVYIEIQGRHPMMGRQQVSISNGSGFIVSQDGLILTNAHVVANKIRGPQSVKVKLPDGRMVDGHVVAVDSVSDLAAVKIDDGKNLPVMKLGKSSHLRPGEWVIAMGSPLTLSNTITAGIVSTVSRTSKELGLSKDIDYIQTDAAINFGNSGGPLVNLDGEAIGINTMKVTSGISFAIPIDNAREFLEEVQKRMKSGDASQGWTGWFAGGKKSPSTQGDKRGYIGITMLTLNPGLLNDLKSRMADFPNVSHGVLVYRIIVGSPAQVAGMKAGDIITHIDGKPVKSATAVYNAVHTLQKMEVAVVRGSSSQKLTLTLMPEEAQ
ncbi:serine protease HTRA2, mitochondrial-like [Patiria miniata]|uniref:Serine protease HTRA2, mitochondrial n=1 Tax=Patiria miniata TaxID=46514 RepID=A0A913Z5S2_PATMI|nr:serine protease HTRA2, mitochondrial-like [Patiria miniata]